VPCSCLIFSVDEFDSFFVWGAGCFCGYCCGCAASWRCSNVSRAADGRCCTCPRSSRAGEALLSPRLCDIICAVLYPVFCGLLVSSDLKGRITYLHESVPGVIESGTPLTRPNRRFAAVCRGGILGGVPAFRHLGRSALAVSFVRGLSSVGLWVVQDSFHCASLRGFAGSRPWGVPFILLFLRRFRCLVLALSVPSPSRALPPLASFRFFLLLCRAVRSFFPFLTPSYSVPVFSFPSLSRFPFVSLVLPVFLGRGGVGLLRDCFLLCAFALCEPALAGLTAPLWGGSRLRIEYWYPAGPS